MGAWFQVQVELITHPKTTRLRKQLKCSQGEAAGIILGLFTWGVEHATKEGFFICEDEGDFGSYLQYVNAGTMLTPEGMVEGLKETGWLDITESGPRIHDWDTWQAALYKAKERRESDAARKRETRRNKPPSQLPNASKDENADVPQDRPQDSPQDSPTEEPTPPEVPEPPKYTPAFETFWKAYPRTIGKGEAYKKYKARRNDGYSDEELLEAAKNYANQCRKLSTQKEYIKHPKTFLSDSLPFLDFLPKRDAPEPSQQLPDTSNPFAEYGKEG